MKERQAYHSPTTACTTRLRSRRKTDLRCPAVAPFVCYGTLRSENKPRACVRACVRVCARVCVCVNFIVRWRRSGSDVTFARVLSSSMLMTFSKFPFPDIISFGALSKTQRAVRIYSHTCGAFSCACVRACVYQCTSLHQACRNEKDRGEFSRAYRKTYWVRIRVFGSLLCGRQVANRRCANPMCTLSHGKMHIV